MSHRDTIARLLTEVNRYLTLLVRRKPQLRLMLSAETVKYPTKGRTCFMQSNTPTRPRGLSFLLRQYIPLLRAKNGKSMDRLAACGFDDTSVLWSEALRLSNLDHEGLRSETAYRKKFQRTVSHQHRCQPPLHRLRQLREHSQAGDAQGILRDARSRGKKEHPCHQKPDGCHGVLLSLPSVFKRGFRFCQAGSKRGMEGRISRLGRGLL